MTKLSTATSVCTSLVMPTRWRLGARGNWWAGFTVWRSVALFLANRCSIGSQMRRKSHSSRWCSDYAPGNLFLLIRHGSPRTWRNSDCTAFHAATLALLLHRPPSVRGHSVETAATPQRPPHEIIARVPSQSAAARWDQVDQPEAGRARPSRRAKVTALAEPSV